MIRNASFYTELTTRFSPPSIGGASRTNLMDLIISAQLTLTFHPIYEHWIHRLFECSTIELNLSVAEHSSVSASSSFESDYAEAERRSSVTAYGFTPRTELCRILD